MTEILTESFCERCGTRYTFQTAAPRKSRIKRLKVASRGLRNYVLSDEMTLEDAFADARSDEERSISTEQLDAFHQTFNFCLSCRQYTCANCWNLPENLCLTCAPDLSHEILPAPFPDLGLSPGAVAADAVVAEAAPLDEDRVAFVAALAWPDTDLSQREVGADGEAPAVAGVEAKADLEREMVAAAAAVEAAPEAELVVAAQAVAKSELEVAARVEDVVPEFKPDVAPELEVAAEAVPEAELVVAAEAVPEAGGAEVAAEAVPEAELVVAAGVEVVEPEFKPVVAPELEVAAEADVVEAMPEAGGAEVAAEPPPVIEAAAITAAVSSDEPVSRDHHAAVAAAQTAALLTRFRPDRGLDRELEAETDQPVAVGSQPHADVEAEVEAPAAIAAAAAVVMASSAEPEAALVEPEPVAIEPVAVEAAPQPEPQAQAEPAVAPPAPAERRDDRVEIPTWRITAPDTTDMEPPVAPPVVTPSTTPSAPSTPAWPTQASLETPGTGGPQWPSAAFLPSVPASRGRDAIWVASSLELVEKAGGGVQACVSCGLALSATARFCRRCGSRQD